MPTLEVVKDSLIKESEILCRHVDPNMGINDQVHYILYYIKMADSDT